MSRYYRITDLIRIFKPQSIVETGTWVGVNAARMIAEAAKHHAPESISYTGYDLFQEGSEELHAEEFNVKKRAKLHKVEARLNEVFPASKITLIKGNTRETLKSGVFDFAYIDGGHSIETIRHDYEALKGCKVIVFDDYYVADQDGKIPDISKVGCNLIVEKLPHAIIPSNDYVEGGGYTNLAMVFGV